MSKKSSAISQVPVNNNLTGTTTVNPDLTVNLTLNDLLEIIVEEENEYRKTIWERCELIHPDFHCAAKFQTEFEAFIKTKFKKVIADLSTHFGNIRSIGFENYSKEIYLDFPKARIVTKYCYVNNSNLTNVINFLYKTSGNKFNKSNIPDVNLKQVRISVNKELLSKKTMTNQEIYTKVKELITLPKELLEEIESMRDKYIQSLSFDPNCVNIN
jgi:hypothetical protein